MFGVHILSVLILLGGIVSAAPVPMAKPTTDAVPDPAAKLLKNRKVQKELKLSAEQRIAIVDGLEDISEAIDKKRDKLLKGGNFTPDVFEKLEKEHQEKIDKFLQTTAAKKLSEAHRTRLKQIDRQVRGPAALQDPATAKLLSLTEEQKKKVAAAVKQLEERVDGYVSQMGNDDADNLKEEIVKYRKETMTTLFAGFTADQKEIWKSLLGEPAALDPLELWFSLIEADELMPPP
jgi:hypothetical protein